MTDRELLELAAKAAGHTTRSDNLDVWIVEDDGSPVGRWNPLQDDGQALRLAVKLHISLYADNESYVFGVTREQRQAETDDPESHLGWCECWDRDPYAAMRRAIVRAAAEIGKTRSD